MDMSSLLIVGGVVALVVLWWIVFRTPEVVEDPPIPCYRCSESSRPTWLASWEKYNAFGVRRGIYTAHLCWECALKVGAIFLDDERETLTQQQSGFSD